MGSNLHENVSRFLSQAGSSIVEETVIRMSTQVDKIEYQAE